MEMSEAAAAVLDAGPVIHLDQLDALDVLEGFHPLLISQTVWREVLRHRPGLTIARLRGTEIVADVTSEERTVSMVARIFDLHAGERQALRWMARVGDALFLSDDAAARFAAKTLGYKVHGTIGLLLRAVRRGTRTVGAVRELLTTLPRRSTLHIKSDVLAV